MKVLSLILLCTVLAFPVDAQGSTEQQCNNSVYPPDWPQNCIDAYTLHAENISSFSPEDRRAQIQYLDVACPDCHNSFIDFNIMCGNFDQTVGDFWRDTYIV